MSAVSTVLLFGARDLRIARSYRLPFVVGILASTLSLVTFRLISGLIGRPASLGGAGDYFTFVVAGLFMIGILDTAIAAPASSVRSEQVGGTLEILATRPLSAATLVAGWSAWPMLNSIVLGLATFPIAIALGMRLPNANVIGASVAVLLSAIVFAGIGALGAAFVMAFQQGAGLTGWLSSGLGIVSGVYVPVSILPDWLQWVSRLSPMTYALEAMRGALLDGRSLSQIGRPLGALALLGAIILPASSWLLSLAMNRARRTGTISTY